MELARLVGIHNNYDNTVTIDGKKYILATLHRRMIAAIIDTVCIGMVVGLCVDYVQYLIYGNVTGLDMIANIDASTKPGYSILDMLHLLYVHGVFTRLLMVLISSLMLFGPVIITFWRLAGATPGKLLTKCMIVDARTGQIPSVKQCVVRFLGYTISTAPACLGFMTALVTQKNQAIHDMLAGTVVVLKNPVYS
ncbi:RDD family protein [Rickettsiales endosymbiont of Peranema trichophorum]|uniref:RDD family protein n=1 Tax=Rickettsiales endosymbiont of Peranema trichophorum TaxID=2486577 RepID=UPI0010233F6C|nr:RDD family protein [Rickettsiales endosymbiont of Peranema trichophorum]RZI45634.1 RDD family protein [Rickettsiales endosymbiont of Peranema trichophorum]